MVAERKFSWMSPPDSFHVRSLDLSYPEQQIAILAALIDTLYDPKNLEKGIGRGLSQDELKLLRTQQSLAYRLVSNLGLEEQIPPAVVLGIGVPEFINRETLERWADLTKPKNRGTELTRRRQRAASYYLEELRREIPGPTWGWILSHWD